MPAADTSLTYRLINAGIPAALATDVAAAIAVAPSNPVTVATPLTDSSATPGNATINTSSGRAAFAAAASTVVVTSSLVTVASKVFVQLEGAADATLTSVLGVTLAAGSFTVTGNATATATKKFSFIVIN